ncbi:Na(+)/H(+) antiporter subunit B [Chryseomicrobium excrementi]|uniref:Na(+)/H(+) antiporter subunit B n=1 Tax=Chryseomicrobium excrementi TaxID=2041346 RepID=A0A2M9F1F0_9BACL|nr:Na(+)/H(+) antiporter subunit B [Chryseomicrobium excrementi]PJK17255.1 Na(+)/H(+) antiporter subunit B [Chryseomicrobium excrementi]
MKSNDLILQTSTRVVFFIIFLFSIHIFFAGHYTPGGGFVGGLLMASAIVLLLLAYDFKTVKEVLPFNYLGMTAIGMLIALTTAAGSLVFNVPFFTHWYDYFDFPLLGKTSIHTAMFFDIGVYLVVVGITLTIIEMIGGDS